MSGGKRAGIVAVALIQLACSSASEERQSAVETRLEVRTVRSDDGCTQCESVRFENLYTEKPDFLVKREPELVISKADYMQAIPVMGGYPHDKIWRLRIDLASDDASVVRRFRESFASNREAVYLSINGYPLDVITVGQLRQFLIVGAFDSIESLSKVVGKVDSHTPVEVEVTDGSRARVRAMKDQLQRDEETQKLVDKLVNAIERGDHDEALRLERELADRSETQPSTD